MGDSIASVAEATKVRIREKEAQVLTELSATVNALSSLQEVLDDILALSAPAESSSSSQQDGKNKNVAAKQEQFIKELQEWQGISGN
jgi:hypothetical protein